MSKGNKTYTNVEIDGMTLDAIIAADPTHMSLTRSSMAKLTSRLVSAANKRLSRLEKSGMDIYSPAYKGRVKEGSETAERFSVKGKNFNELQHEFARARQFLNERKTSSVAGARAVKEATEERIGRTFSSKEEANLFWENVKKLEEAGVLNENYTSAQLQRDVAAMMEEDVDFDEMLERATRNGIEAYEDEEEEEDEDIFELQEDLISDDEDEDSFIRTKFSKIKIF